jgi:hypothetical protein
VAVLRELPLCARARCACVSRAWRDAAHDLALWGTLLWEDCGMLSEGVALSDEALATLCARAGATLRELWFDASHVTPAGGVVALRDGRCGRRERPVRAGRHELHPQRHLHHGVARDRDCPPVR